MTPETEKMREHLKEIDWFANCGTYRGDDYVPVKSKAQALKSFTSRKWFGFANPIRNEHGRRIIEKFETVDDYNAAADEIYSGEARKLVRALAELVAHRLSDRTEIIDALHMDIAGILWEADLSNEVPPMFYIPLVLPVYEAGFLPCGWEGKAPAVGWSGNGPEDLPPGKLRVF